MEATPRAWEEFYRRRWQHDKMVRTSHGVNCSGSCSWMVYVKDGIVGWELQATDWPQINSDTPNYEPRGCQRGISSSWYVYSPVRPKYPYVRGVLLDFYREAKARGLDPVEAWANIVEDPEKARKYKNARGKGGWRRVTWDEVTELVSGALIHTIKKYGPDRVAGFSPIPAMSMVSWCSGARLTNLLGGSLLSFYEWYHDNPHVQPKAFGEQTDVHESADWYQSTYWINMGTNLPMTRTADAHYASEFKYKGGKLVVFSPNHSDVVKFADTWVQLRPGTDAAILAAMNHVVVKEFFVDRQVEYFQDYVKRFTSLPFLLTLKKRGEHYVPGRLLRASDVADYHGQENAQWKLLVWDSASGRIRLPKGTMGFRWEKEPTGNWNLQMEDAVTGEALDPALSLLDGNHQEVPVAFADFTGTFNVTPGQSQPDAKPKMVTRGVPVQVVKTTDGAEVLVTTEFDLLAAQLGVPRGLGGDYPTDYDDPKTYTPAWQEQETGVSREVAIQIAREWALNAEKTKGKSLIIAGPGCTHWYHSDLYQRFGVLLGALTGCHGVNGGGWCHYVGTEKARNVAAVVNTIGTARDWNRPPRLMNSTSYWYFHTDQWRYDPESLDPFLVPWAEKMRRYNHAADMNALAVRLGWLPWYPTLDKKSSLEVVRDAEAAGAQTEGEIVDYVAHQMKEGKLRFAIEDVDAKENSPKCLFVWRGNLIGTSMRGHMAALKHLLGTHHNVLAEPTLAKGKVHEVEWREEAPEGKLDLLCTMEFRMISSANYADVVLPAAHWYEKNDITVTDLHTFIHPFQAAIDPPWETKPDWEGFKAIAKKFSELAKKHFPEPVKDLVITPLITDTPDEMAQPMGELKDWKRGEVEAVPGKTMPRMQVITRDYTKVYDMYCSLGPLAATSFGAKGVVYDITPLYEELKKSHVVGTFNGGHPSLEMDKQVAEVILAISPETNGESSYLGFKSLEKKVGRNLTHVIEGHRELSYNYDALCSQPRRVHTSPHWFGIDEPGRTYSPWSLNIETLLPFRTLTGRIDNYLDHEVYRELGEALPIYKPPIDTTLTGLLDPKGLEPNSKVFRFLTPHGKWTIHSTFWDNLWMQRLFRGGQVVWINPQDAGEIGVQDNDWLEAYSQMGIIVARAAVSHQVPRGSAIMYHMSERNLNIPFSKLAQEKGASDWRGGNNNAPTRIQMNPSYMVGGYAQCTYYINYWGPSPAERDMVIAIRKMPLEKGEKVRYQ
ncbi:MAG: nitrate reductase subunit alpha [Chloroflexi bacterium]|nr:nitrate reductase subunit alpha [Chloroflexota bacterium]